MFEIRTSTRKFVIMDDKEEQYFDAMVNQLLNMTRSTESTDPVAVNTEKKEAPTPPYGNNHGC